MGRRLVKAMEVETNKIKSPIIKKAIIRILNDCTDYNCDMGASSTGKYHPLADLGPGGLIRHVKFVCRNIETIMKMWPQYDGEKWDIPYCSAILHDFCKYTEKNQTHSHLDHPLIMASKIREFKKDFPEIENQLEQIALNVASHMSRWNLDKKGNKIGELPTTMEQAFVAIADMMASQKTSVAFYDKNNNILDYQEDGWRK